MTTFRQVWHSDSDMQQVFGTLELPAILVYRDRKSAKMYMCMFYFFVNFKSLTIGHEGFQIQTL